MYLSTVGSFDVILVFYIQLLFKISCEFVILLAGRSVSQRCKVEGACNFGPQQVWLYSLIDQ